jgi:hypothetical protein
MEGPLGAYQIWAQLTYILTAEHEYGTTGSEETLKVVINTDRGLPYLPRAATEARKTEILMARAETGSCRTVPDGVHFLVATMDVQGGKKNALSFRWLATDRSVNTGLWTATTSASRCVVVPMVKAWLLISPRTRKTGTFCVPMCWIRTV